MSGHHRHHDDALPADQAEALAAAVFSTTVEDINGLGIDGSAFFGQTEQTLWSRVQIAGLEPDQTHLMHIHGRLDEAGLPIDSVTPTLADDLDGDGFIELAEGAPRYGPIIANLTTPVGGQLEDFPTAPNGRIAQSEAYDLDDPALFNGDFDREQLLPLSLREFVVHGDTVPDGAGAGTDGEVDGTSGFKLLLPVGSGELEPATMVYTADLTTLNDSGVTGQVNLLLQGDELTVHIRAQGLEPGEVHVQHIHGPFDAEGRPIEAVTPTLEQDTDGDGFIEVLEGAATYGPVLVNLTDPAGAGLEGFPTAPNGEVRFSTTFDLNDPASFAAEFDRTDVLPLGLREIVLHGLTVDGTAGEGTPNEVDGTSGYKLILPVASGAIEFAGIIDGREAVLPPVQEGVDFADAEAFAIDANRLRLSAGDVNFGVDPMVAANAYTNNVAGAETTVQYVLDHGQGTLGTLANNAGTLVTIGKVTLDGEPLDFDGTAGFDIKTDADGTNTAFALLTSDGTPGLYTIDLATGATTSIGALGGSVTGVKGLAVSGDEGLALGADGGTLLRFNLADPSIVETVQLSGAAQTLDAIDVRPATGELFGYDSATNAFYTVDPASGGLTLASSMAVQADTTVSDMDWNPTIDRMRLVTETDQNIVYNPETGTSSDAATQPLFYETPDATITFADEHAGFQNTLGAFLIDEQGGIGPVATVFSAVEHEDALPGPGTARPGGGDLSPGDSVSLADLFDSSDLTAFGGVGLFLVADGGSANPPEVFGEGELRFVDSATGGQASLQTDPAALELRHVDADGNEQAVEGRVVHALSSLNTDGEVLAVGGIDPLDGILQLAFEDGQDSDFNDLEIAFDNGTGGDRVVSAAEIEQLFALPTSQSVDQVVVHDHAAMAA